MKNIPILILHGWNLSAAKFKPLQDELVRRGFQVLCPDLPGFGKEKKPDKPFFLSDYVSFVERKLNSKRIEKVILVGHSFGGRIGIKLAVQNPKLLHALILTGTPGINPVPGPKILFFLFLAKTGNAIFSLPVLSVFKDKLRHLLYKTARATDFYNTDKKMRETFKNIVRENLSSYLKKITIPTLFLWGKEDMIVPLRIAQAMSELMVDAKLVVIPEARHGLPWTHPKIFVAEMEKFLEKIE